MKMTDACERLKSQLVSANKKVVELEEQTSILKEENTSLHHKMAQAKASIDNRTSPDVISRPDSSKLRVRLDDSSNISKDK
jgi:hypothetical protein